MTNRGKRSVAAALLLIGLSGFAYAVQVGQRSTWLATGLEDLDPDIPATPTFLLADPSSEEWTTAVDVTQTRSGDQDIWTADARVSMPATARALRQLRYLPPANAYTIASALVGIVHLDGRPMRPTHFVITQLSDMAHVSFTTTVRTFRSSTSSVVVNTPTGATEAAPRTVTVTVADYDIVSVAPREVVTQTPRRVEVRGPLGDEDFVFISAVNARLRDPSVPAATFSVPVRSLAFGAWTGLLGTVAWLVTYLVLGQSMFRDRQYAWALRRVALTLAVLHLGARALVLASEAMSWLAHRTPDITWADSLTRAAYPGPTVLLLALLFVAPPVATTWAAGRPTRSGRWWACCVALAGLLAWPLTLLATRGASSTLVLATATATVVATSTAGLVAWWGRLPVAPSCATALATAVLATVSAPATGTGWVGDSITLLPVVTGVATTVGSLLALGWVASRKTVDPARRLFAVLVVAVISVAAAVPQSNRAAGWFLAGYATFPLPAVGTATLAAGVAAALYREVRHSGSAKRVRRLGIAFALLTFSAPAALTAYVPLVFLLVAPLVTWWALPEPDDASPLPIGDEEHAKNVAAILRARPAERSANRLRRALRAKIERGEMTDAECEEKVSALQGIAVRARENSSPDLERAAFGHYLLRPQRQAVYGALAGLIVGLPWVLLGVGGLADAASFQPFPILAFTTFAYFDLARWTAYGFVFGACFPLIRGRTGLAKGWTLFLTTAPLALAVALADSGAAASERTRLAVAVAELFLHFMVLGLLADLAALKRAGKSRLAAPGYSIGRLVDVHDFRAVVAWGTGVTVAFGTALSTAIVSGATAFVVGVLQPQEQPTIPAPSPPVTQQK